MEKIKKSLRDGNLCIIPTDTILGIFSTSNHTAVTKIFHTKKRDLNKPLAIFLPNVEVIGKYGIETEESKAFTRQNLPGAYTILLKATEFAKAELSPLLISRDGKVGIRIPNQKDLLDIASGFVICGTSVNISGETFATNENISQEITDFVEYFYQDEQVLSQKPSTIIDFSSDERVVVR